MNHQEFAEASGLNVSRETFDRLNDYANVLLQWNARINLIDRKTESQIWQRHIVDSAQLIPHIPATATSLLDIGSGAGLPALVIAILRPDITITCAERDQRKSVFLLEAARVCDLKNVNIEICDAANVSGVFDVVSARALAPLDELFNLIIHRLHASSICLFPKGKTHAMEIETARRHWEFDLSLVPSITDGQARILRVSHLRPH